MTKTELAKLGAQANAAIAPNPMKDLTCATSQDCILSSEQCHQPSRSITTNSLESDRAHWNAFDATTMGNGNDIGGEMD
jgi:hypothetical protein